MEQAPLQLLLMKSLADSRSCVKYTIMERFARGSGSTTSGSGLDLALVAQQAELHDGRVEVGERPGGGARISVRLPRTAGQPPEAAVRPGGRPSADAPVSSPFDTRPPRRLARARRADPGTGCAGAVPRGERRPDRRPARPRPAVPPQQVQPRVPAGRDYDVYVRKILICGVLPPRSPARRGSRTPSRGAPPHP